MNYDQEGGKENNNKDTAPRHDRTGFAVKLNWSSFCCTTSLDGVDEIMSQRKSTTRISNKRISLLPALRHIC